MKKWNITSNNTFPTCTNIETLEHVIEGHYREKLIVNLINEGIERWILNMKVKSNFSWIKNDVLIHWNRKNAIGILNRNLIGNLKEDNISIQDMSKLAKRFINIGFIMWSIRCKDYMSYSRQDPMDIPYISPL